MFADIFHYSFLIRGIEAGLLVGAIAPLIGMFLVLRRYSLIADTLSHVSLAGVALGLLLKINPLLTAFGASAIASLAIERLRASKKMYGDTALSLFLSGSLAVAILLIGLAHGFSVDLFSYLFGSIVTVTTNDLWLMSALAVAIMIIVFAFFKEMVFLSFDEESALVAGIPVRGLNMLFMILSASAVALAMPVVGILLISALLVLPAVAALQFRKNFLTSVIIAEALSIGSVLIGIIASFYLNASAGGVIVLLLLVLFGVIFSIKR